MKIKLCRELGTIRSRIDNGESKSSKNVACRPKNRRYLPSYRSMSFQSSNRPIRVGHVLTSLCEGGLERFSLLLATQLPKDKFAIKIYSLMRENAWLDEFKSRGIEVETFDADNKPSLTSLPRNLKALLQLSRSLARDRIDIVHTPDFFPAFMGRVASLVARVPARVHTLHSVYDWYPSLVFPVQRLLGKRTDVITAVSRPVLEYSMSREGLPADKYRLIHNGADEKRFRPDSEARRDFRQTQGWGQDDLVVGAVGARTPRKGHPLLAEAMLPLLHNDPKVRLAIIGSNTMKDADTRPRIEAMAARAGVGERVHFLSPRADIESVYRSLDIHCMPSDVEGLSFAAIEGLMSGCVSVFSDLPAFREVVDSGRTGYLFEKGNVIGLRQSLVQAAAVPWSDPVWVERARNHAVENFGQARMLEGYAAIYDELGGRRKRQLASA
jgi:glycosyltransferase involved in cell wall biosynthesis